MHTFGGSKSRWGLAVVGSRDSALAVPCQGIVCNTRHGAWPATTEGGWRREHTILCKLCVHMLFAGVTYSAIK